MLNLAHRGFRSQYPENTMIAFEKAIDAGACGVEFDVHLTKDNEIVIIHDERVDRTTDSVGRVCDFTLKELKKINASNGFNMNVTIPTLREYFEFAKGKDILTNIELKTGVYWYDKIENLVCDMIEEYSLRDKIIISSFNHNNLLKVKEIDKDYKCGALVESWILEPVDYLLKYGFEYYHPNAYGVDKALVDSLHKNGIGINVWYGREFYNYEKMYELGVDGIITDYPDIITNLINNK